MEDSGKHGNNSKFLNPWMLQFQKMSLELKCPLCLNLFKRPMLLPCNHIFCSSCIADCSRPSSECAFCNTHYTQRDLRSLPIVENMVAIYKSLDAAFYANLSQHRSSDELPVLSKEPSKISLEDNLHREQSVFSQTVTERVEDPFSLDHSREVDMGNNHKYEKSGNVMHGKDNKFGGSWKEEILMKCSQLDGGAHEDCGPVEMDINQVTQSSPGSPPFCDTKGSDNDCSDRDSEHRMPAERLESSSSKRASKENEILEKRIQLRSESSASETEGLVRDSKRPKNLIHDNNGMQANVTHQSKPMTSECNVDLKSGIDLDSCSNTSVCSFCQSSRASEVTGPMLHYKNGNLVTGAAAFQPNVIHVHKLCIEWSPQAYFVDETVKNLRAEVARGAKLKCSKCGQKGAALGCYVRSCRRTYHFPCAMEISACRWDDEEYLMLCPAHSHVKFPSEKSISKKQSSRKHPAPSHLTSKLSNSPLVLSDDSKHLVFCGSALSTDEKIHLINFASRIGATVTKFWTPDVTHVIAATDSNGACARTLKVLMAILNGQWILKMDWVTASMEVMRPVEEELYEISLDNHGCQGGPKAGRLRALANAPKLFNGFSMYFSGDYTSDYREDLVDLVVAGGGTILESKEELHKGHDCKETSKLIVYNLDPPQGSRLGDEVTILWERLNEAEDLAATTGSQVVGHTWILESIAACNLQPFLG
ncbi:BRCA1-associated RING domain protein 1 [Neltuma alba]|uniref:BRCA1-associated RING domain protein 1 n=1 Tax=Neltuma alba TaxID=207710 RepID=UPI0010A48C22|nr:BRCA1-associated RING domain protein 1 [Prosopis alba]